MSEKKIKEGQLFFTNKKDEETKVDKDEPCQMKGLLNLIALCLMICVALFFIYWIFKIGFFVVKAILALILVGLYSLGLEYSIVLGILFLVALIIQIAVKTSKPKSTEENKE